MEKKVVKIWHLFDFRSDPEQVPNPLFTERIDGTGSETLLITVHIKDYNRETVS